MAKEVKFNIKINVDGKEQISAATVDAKEFAKNIKKIKNESKEEKFKIWRNMKNSERNVSSSRQTQPHSANRKT